jgi:predicted ATPase
MSKLGVLAEPVLVGREKELEELKSFLNLAVEGKGKTVFVSGDAGSGKTRLAREFLKAAVKQGVAVMAGWCLSDSQVPYFPFMEAFNNYYAAQAEEAPSTSLLQPQAELGLGKPVRVGLDRGEGEITSWLTGAKQAGKAVMLSAQAWKDQVFAAVSETLHTIAAQGPVVFFIEDVHWADSASLALLHYVARAINNSERILVLATFRSEELTADAEGHPHPLAETLRLMRREELFIEIRLPSLNQACVSKIAQSMIGGSLQPKLAGKLTDESRGNPLFIVESLRMLYERKSLIQENGEWRLAVDELGIPNKIKDVILRRLACLKYTQRRVLDAASVIGEEFDVELLSIVLGQDSLDVLETLNVVAHSTSLVLVEENRYRFDHAKSRETLYEELSSPLKRGYHNRIAEKLEKTVGATQRFSDVAYHYAQAGNNEKAVKYSFAAGQEALDKFSNGEAIKHFTYVLQSIGKAADRAEQRERAFEGLADALLASNRIKESMNMYENLAEEAVTAVVKLRALRKAMEAAWQLGDPAHLMDLVKRAGPYAEADHLESGRVLMSRGRAFQLQTMYSNGAEDFKAALRVFEEEYSLWDVGYALIGTGAQKNLADSILAIAIFEELGDFRWQNDATWAANLTFRTFLLEHEADELCRRYIELDEKLKIGSYWQLTYAYINLAMPSMRIGDFDEALSYALKALEFSQKTDSLAANAGAYSLLTVIYSRVGDFKKAQEYFEKLTMIPPECTFGSLPLAQAVFSAAKCQWQESEKFFDEAFKIIPAFRWTVKSLHVWALEKQGRFEDAKAIREQMHAAYREAQERYKHVDVQVYLMARRSVVVGKEFEMRLDLVNVARTAATLTRIENVFPREFKVAGYPSFCSLQDGSLVMKEKNIGPFEVETMKLRLAANKTGTYVLNPEIIYLDDLGNLKKSNPEQIIITVEPAKPEYEVLPERVTTGTVELDKLLYGGIPEGYAVALVSPGFEERQKLVENYVEAGPKSGQETFYVTTEPGNAKVLAQGFPSSMYLFVCNPRAELMIKDLPNVYRIKGVDNLTEIDIAITKASRQLKASPPSPRRASVEIVSDVLLQHHAVTTRKWLSGLIQDLKSKGFTIMAVIDPLISPDEVPAILGLFDGEIRMAEKENEMGRRKVLEIFRLHNQRYLENEVVLTKGNLLHSP